MNRLAKVTCLIAVLAGGSLTGESAGQADGQGSRPPHVSTAERENLAAAAAWDAAFNSEDLDALMALYARGAVSMPPGVPALVGRRAIRADFEFLFANFDFHHQTTVVQLEVQGPMAVERGEYTMTVVPADGSGAFVETGKHMITRRKIDDAWVSVMEIWNIH